MAKALFKIKGAKTQRIKMSSLFDFGKRYENTYQTAPLSFLGQKKNMLKVFFRVLEKYFKIDDDMVFLDLFGGSGLLSHHLKCCYPNNRVVWNDFDNYAERLKPERIKILKEIQAFANELLKQKQFLQILFCEIILLQISKVPNSMK